MILTLSAILAGIMFFIKKHKLQRFYWTPCETCTALHLSLVIYLCYVLSHNYGIVLDAAAQTNPLTIWLIGYTGYKFLQA